MSELEQVLQAITELKSEMNQRFDGVDQRFDGVDQRFDGVDQRLDGVDQRLDGVDQRLDGVDQRLDGVDQRFDRVDQTLARHGKSIRWIKRELKKLGLEFERFKSDNRALNELLREEDLVKRLDEVEKENETFDVRLSALESASGGERVA